MSENRTTVYADALFSVARAENNVDEVTDELFRFARILEANEELRSTLSDPHVPAGLRQQVVEDVLGGRATPTTVALVSMIVAAGRIGELGKIVDELAKRTATASGAVIAEVRSAVALSDDQKARLGVAITAQTGREVTIRNIVDPAILGGVVTQIGDSVIDGSVRTRLNQLRDAF